MIVKIIDHIGHTYLTHHLLSFSTMLNFALSEAYPLFFLICNTIQSATFLSLGFNAQFGVGVKERVQKIYILKFNSISLFAFTFKSILQPGTSPPPKRPKQN